MDYDGPNAIANAIGYAEFYSRSHDAVIRVYDSAKHRNVRGIRFGSRCHGDSTRCSMTRI
jgi:hypothetical protein